jgi:hypothetical protein
MKNQNFGDNRDLLKIDLVYEILKTRLVYQFIYIPMLTEDAEQKEEPHICRHDAIGGTGNVNLVEFLDKCIVNNKRKIAQLEELFKQAEIRTVVYKKDEFFTQEGRKVYFEGIKKDLLSNSLILVDPDKGLEDNKNDSGNLMYTELRDIYEKIDENSILMFTQSIPQNLYDDYLDMRTAEIKDIIPDCQPISLDDLDTIIFFMTRNKSLQNRLLQFLGEYAKKYAKSEDEEAKRASQFQFID